MLSDKMLPPGARILIHDYSGHAFTVQLARWLAARGYETCYCYSGDIESPKGTLQRLPEDPQCLSIQAITERRKIAKYSPLMRLRQEHSYGRRIARAVREISPAVILSNAPPAIQASMQSAASDVGAQFIYWMQDIYGLAVAHLLKQKAPLLAPLAILAKLYEHAVMRRSDWVVCISQAFMAYCHARGVAASRMALIENWPSLPDFPLLPKDNDWARAQGLDGKFVFLFSGTLGLKHDPQIFVSLAHALTEIPDAFCVVVSQGAGREWLEERKASLGLDRLRLFDFQSHKVLPEVLATGDVLMLILEPFASELSAPSKVLSYFCARRPIIAAMPHSNHSARILEQSGAGIVVGASDAAAFITAAKALLADPQRRGRMAEAGRAYAERTFDMNEIGARFLAVFGCPSNGGG